MDKIRVGIPRALHYYYYGTMWQSFLEELGCEVIVSPMTNRDILNEGIKVSSDEMCLSLKVYFGHVAYLQHRCDYILVPRIDNFGTYEQTCTNFLGLYDMVHNLFTSNILSYNVDVAHHESEMKAFIHLGSQLGKGVEQSKIAYFNSLSNLEKERKREYHLMKERLIHSQKLKLLWISHPYNSKDAYLGGPIKKMLAKMNVELIDASCVINEDSIEKAKLLSPSLYWMHSKELIGTIEVWKPLLDGILFLSSFPCGPDSLVNELVLRKLDLPHLNLIIDDVDGMAGMETRLESFLDILEQKKSQS